MSLPALVDQLVEERSLEALEKLTGTRREEVLEALIEAVGAIIASEHGDPNDDAIIESAREHLVDAKAVGVCIDGLKSGVPETREFALSCLSEIADHKAIPGMIALLDDSDEGVRNAAAAHLALLTKYDFGHSAKKWREWHQKRTLGLVEQAQEDLEDKARVLRMRMRSGKNKNEEQQQAQY